MMFLFRKLRKKFNRKFLLNMMPNCCRIPDPLKLEQGWLSEEDGVRYWPVTLYPDIFNFLAFHPNELASSDLSDYKISKAYCYFSQGWLAPLKFNNISGDSKVCLLRGTCRPSQRINDTPHKLWLCLCKETGKILVTHCTCMAGMSQTCNLVAAALFCVESACRMVLNNPSCTSTACQWLPNNKAVEPVKIKDLKLKREDFGKRGKEQAGLNTAKKRKFNPIAKSTYKLTFEDVAAALKAVCKESDSILFTALPKVDSQVPQGAEAVSVHSLKTLFNASESGEDFLGRSNSYYDEDKIKCIEKITRGQNENTNWNLFRKHVITASKAHDVKARHATLQRAKDTSDVNLLSIFDKISGNDLNLSVPAVRYGQTMENEAVDSFVENFKVAHKDVSVTECGLFLLKDMHFVGASPDHIIECSCCGTACLEIKCHFSIRHTTPTDKMVLNRNHKYFKQCQVQMASVGLSTCHFYVWTPHGSFLEKISFDEMNWLQLKHTLEDFYVNYYVPYLFNE